MAALFRLRDLAIKALVRAQWADIHATSPRLAVVPHEHVGLAVVTNGLYEREELDCLSALVSERKLGAGICLDIGANIGNHAVIWSRLFERVVCFEPNPQMGALLRANLALNRCGNVLVVDVGLGIEDAELPFSFHEPGNDGTGTFARWAGDISLPVRHGDGLIEELGLGERPITLVKCDVEGFEHLVFRGLAKTLARHRPVVIFESNTLAAGETAWNSLRGYGYDRLYEIRHSAASLPQPFREIARLATGHRCWIERIDAVPTHAANLIAATVALD
jgi:FkbM family methyltransferase